MQLFGNLNIKYLKLLYNGIKWLAASKPTSLVILSKLA